MDTISLDRGKDGVLRVVIRCGACGVKNVGFKLCCALRRDKNGQMVRVSIKKERGDV